MEARVADFEFAKLIQSDESIYDLAGMYGYIDPSQHHIIVFISILIIFFVTRRCIQKICFIFTCVNWFKIDDC